MASRCAAETNGAEVTAGAAFSAAMRASARASSSETPDLAALPDDDFSPASAGVRDTAVTDEAGRAAGAGGRGAGAAGRGAGAAGAGRVAGRLGAALATGGWGGGAAGAVGAGRGGGMAAGRTTDFENGSAAARAGAVGNGAAGPAAPGLAPNLAQACFFSGVSLTASSSPRLTPRAFKQILDGSRAGGPGSTPGWILEEGVERRSIVAGNGGAGSGTAGKFGPGRNGDCAGSGAAGTGSWTTGSAGVGELHVVVDHAGASDLHGFADDGAGNPSGSVQLDGADERGAAVEVNRLGAAGGLGAPDGSLRGVAGVVHHAGAIQRDGGRAIEV